ncbi:hypothetical protein [Brevundimonas naejangsanensis]|uniref:hypothetical protein n=1 Tax=Brevundimonas naejangsanensis TaxID=588932 RepID=UPI0013C4DECC|nr:hypothetical protein [Brevundimonas naejangsanensis]
MLLGFVSFGAGWFASALADLAADALRRNGDAPPTTPAFYLFSRNPAALGIRPSFRRLYSNLHRDYDNRFITGCVYIARCAFPLAAILLPIGFLAAFLQS